MSENELKTTEAVVPHKQAGKQSMIVILLALIVLLLIGVIALFLYQQNQNQKFQRLQAAMVHFDKLEKEEKLLVEQERLKSELARAEAARTAAVQQNTYNPCRHVYVGKVSKTTGWLKLSYTVMGYSAASGKASVRYNHDGSTSEIYCSQIPE